MRHLRRADARKENAEHREDIGCRAERRARISAEALLVDDDRRREIVQRVRVRLAVARQKHLHESREGLVDETLRLGGDGVEHQ